ncbi:uncharacterized protein LOC143449356 [Clavelina lepadiformis]|uniref:uncharacterized protein LOC143449356 n=1 Tax=Clavelina lepadiformis TaxID=159417 RepID=UPI0040419D92
MGRYFILSLGVTWSVIFLSESQLRCPCEVTSFSNRESWTWGSWITEADGACDCASNIRRRNRRCHQIRNNGFQVVQTLSCPKSDICSDVNSCAATWSRWETVERCSALCGQPGIVIQRRRCFTHQNRASRQCNPETQEDTQIRNDPCHGPPCPSTTASPETTSIITTMFTTANPTSRSLVITGSSTNLTRPAITQDTKGENGVL